ncbi:MAG: tetratricopeptide repeat protein [Spirochaetales bacterium]|nr:tetratricopeptide repeat protein [Spirochaetales bacterium]
MILDYERYSSRKAKKKNRYKAKIVIIFLFILLLLSGAYFFGFFSLFTTGTTAEAKIPAGYSIEQIWNHVPWNYQPWTIEENSQIPFRNITLKFMQKTYVSLLNEIITQCDAILEEKPIDARALFYRGSAYYFLAHPQLPPETRQENLTQALISLRRARLSQTKKYTPEITYLLGKIYFHKKRYFYDCAIEYLEKSLELGYKGSDTYEYLAIAFEESGVIDRSIEYLLRAYSEDQKDIYLFFLAKYYAKSGDTKNAKEYLGQTLKLSKNIELQTEARFLLGELLFNERDYKNAEKLYKDILAENDTSAEAHFRLALVYEKYGDYAQYRYELRRTLENDPSHSGARNRL